MLAISRLIQEADRALSALKAGFRNPEESYATPADLEDALQVVHDAKRELLDLTGHVRNHHDTNKPSALEIIRAMNPGKHLPSGAELAEMLKKRKPQ